MKILTLTILIVSLSLSSAFAEEIGKIKKLTGEVIAYRDGKTVTLKNGEAIQKNDTIVTRNKSSVGILFTDNSSLALGSNSKISFSKYEFDPVEKKSNFFASLKKGTMTYLSGLIAKMRPDAVKFETPVSVAGIRGTKIAISAESPD